MGCGASSAAVPFMQVVAGVLENAEGHKVDSTTLLQGKIKLVLFSADVQPVNQFALGLLAPLYQALKARNENFEVLFVSDDTSLQGYTNYLARQPWWSIPYADEQRRQGLHYVLNCQGPQLVVISETDEIITEEGMQAVADDPRGDNFPWKPSKMAGFMDMAAGALDE